MATKAVKTRKPAAKTTTRKVSSKKVGPPKVSSPKVSSSSKKLALQQKSRTSFVAGAVLVAAALVAMTIGFTSWHKKSDQVSAVTPAAGSLFLQSLDSKGAEVGSTVSVALYENSGNQPVNTVQSNINYPADKLQVVAIKPASAFPQEAATDTATPGLVRIARSINTKSSAVTGAKPVATIEFKVLQKADSPLQLGIDPDTSFLVRSTDNQNILQKSAITPYELTQ